MTDTVCRWFSVLRFDLPFLTLCELQKKDRVEAGSVKFFGQRMDGVINDNFPAQSELGVSTKYLKICCQVTDTSSTTNSTPNLADANGPYSGVFVKSNASASLEG